MFRPPSAFEASLFDDGTALVAVVDGAGIIQRVNLWMMKHAIGRSVIGCSLRAVFGGAVGEEVAALVHEAVESRSVRRRVGMLVGGWHVTTARPLSAASEGEGGCLLVSQPAMWDAAEEICQAEGAPPVAAARHHDLGRLSILTERELVLLALIARGLSTAEIAAAVHRSQKTVEWHRCSLGAKLGVRSRVELALIGLRSGVCGLAPDQLAHLRARSTEVARVTTGPVAPRRRVDRSNSAPIGPRDPHEPGVIVRQGAACPSGVGVAAASDADAASVLAPLGDKSPCTTLLS